MTEVVMPQMGESIVEGTLTKWLKKPGDHVERDEPLFEISTDKVDTEIPSPAAGTLSEIVVEEGKTVGINTVVGRIADGSADGRADGAAHLQATAAPISSPSQTAVAAEPAAPIAQTAAGPILQTAAGPSPSQTAAAAPISQTAPSIQQAAPPQAAPPQTAGPETVAAPAATVVEETAGPLSPLVRKMARENNIDLSRVKGTGAGGRITKQDLESHLVSRLAQAVAPAPPQPSAEVATIPAAAKSSVPVPAQSPMQVPPAMPAALPPSRVEPMSMMRQKIAEHMVFSKHTSAHVTTVHKADMTRVAKLRERLKAQFQAQYGFGLTFLPFVMRAATAALRQFPLLNASIEGTNILYHRDVNLGMAVALENGLIVPVIRSADEKNVVGLQRAIVDLSTRARSRQLRPDEVQGGTFSITNFGSFGSLFATPVINQPQVAILGVGSVEKEAVVVDDAIAIRSMCFLALTFDHRLIDGALADQFTAKVKSVLEDWSEEVI